MLEAGTQQRDGRIDGWREELQSLMADSDRHRNDRAKKDVV
jgi:hypothetical protein